MQIKSQIITFILLFLSACQSPPISSQPVVEASQSPVAPSTTTQREEPKAAPQLSAKDQDGKIVDFADLYSRGTVLVYFYPKAGTPGCTDQACSLRDAYEDLLQENIIVVGVSTDGGESLRKFREENSLPFTLVSDPDGDVLKAFGVSQLGGLASREAFLIQDAKIVWHDDSASTSQQAADVLAEVKKWKSSEI